MDKIVTRVWTDYIKLSFEDGSYIHVSPMVSVIDKEKLSDTKLPRGLYSFNPFGNLLYLEELEWYEVDSDYTLHFIGYTTDEFIRENITRRINSL